jgi:tetratricopeptide (TPR) repeat protein
VQNLGCSDRALEIDPQFDRAWYRRGITFSRMGRHGDAISNYERALAINPNCVDAASCRRITLHHTNGNAAKP